MKNLMVCTVAALLLFSANIVSAQEKNFIDTPYIEVTGKAEMEVVPDEIYVGITPPEKNIVISMITEMTLLPGKLPMESTYAPAIVNIIENTSPVKVAAIVV